MRCRLIWVGERYKFSNHKGHEEHKGLLEERIRVTFPIQGPRAANRFEWYPTSVFRQLQNRRVQPDCAWHASNVMELPNIFLQSLRESDWQLHL